MAAGRNEGSVGTAIDAFEITPGSALSSPVDMIQAIGGTTITLTTRNGSRVLPLAGGVHELPLKVTAVASSDADSLIGYVL